MSVIGVFTKGRATGHPDATSILKYIPRARVPWQPSRFSRANLDEADLARLWGMGRYRDGYGNYNSGYSTDKTHVLEDNTVNIIPKHELEKYMPDISIGPKALVTPVSLMAARNGHRVTHDMLHSYDPYIGRLQKPALVDHENITVEDPNRVGLNAATLDCRGRIYRWLRRGPFFQEDFYFRRSTQLTRNGPVPVSVAEAPLMAKIVRLASKGHLKAACEEYRKVTSVPPVAVYRALTAACVPGAKLADAIAIFEDGNSRLFYVARDGEVLLNLMRCAVRANHRVRVMWVYNVMRGRRYENVVVRAEVDPVWRYRVAALALEYLLDTHAGEEARAVYAYLVEEDLVECDVHARMGKLMQDALTEGKTISLKDREATRGLALVQNVEAVSPQVAATIYDRYWQELTAQAESHGGNGQWAAKATAPLPPPPANATPEQAVEWLQQNFADVNVMAILRLARFKRGKKDLLAKDRATYLQRVAQWVELLSQTHQQREEAPLPYLRKSRPSLTNPNVRVAWLPERRPRNTLQAHPGARLLAHEEGYQFHYTADTRLVEETFVYAGSNALQAKYLAQRPQHREVPVAQSLILPSPSQGEPTSGSGTVAIEGGGHHRPARVLHHSVHEVSSGGKLAAPSGTPGAKKATGARPASAAEAAVGSGESLVSPRVDTRASGGTPSLAKRRGESGGPTGPASTPDSGVDF